MVTALDQPSDRVRGLEAGADDFLTKPVSDVALIARVRSLARLKLMTDELRMRAVTSRDIGIESPEREAVAEAGRDGRILIVDDRASSYERIAAMLAGEHSADIEADPNAGLFHAAEGNYDLLIVSLGLENFDGLRLCSQVRSLDRTRNVPILAISDAENNCAARARAGDRRQRLSARVRSTRTNCWRACAPRSARSATPSGCATTCRLSIEMAITDALTGPLQPALHGDATSARWSSRLLSRGKPLTVLVLDIDYFKSINDTHGHDAGDDVLREFALRIRKSIRGIDLACRYGGEEFVVVMPETDLAVATMVAERLRRRIASEPFPIQQGARSIEVTISIGIAALGSRRQCGERAQARRSGALSRQARRPQPRRAGRSVEARQVFPIEHGSKRSRRGSCRRNATVNPNALG